MSAHTHAPKNAQQWCVGGGLYVVAADPPATPMRLDIERSTLRVNKTTSRFGVHGGALDAIRSTVAISRAYIESNDSGAGYGGGIALQISALNLLNSDVVGNQSGGIVALNQQQPVILTRVRVQSNASSFGGGGLDLIDAPLTVVDSVLASNRSAQDGGAIRSDSAIW